jgi:hypothetical protein
VAVGSFPAPGQREDGGPGTTRLEAEGGAMSGATDVDGVVRVFVTVGLE